ncbi:SAM-dependent methyltransferase [Desulfonema ishimotonii]|uniref:SAM-dependent methyltransferase n=1 Tax=Desulfonema ishimotonii TaxID=45657 RepID=A0A401FS17_9BACT|nr:methyltransferase domain-containing protein [Desulfonema ishimotonii]GBC59754.1 SAM-dependent methyltransferase [Desulfonema ishimotonii]
MKKVLRDILICPVCLPLEHSLSCTILEADGEDIISGYLYCRGCSRKYPIEDGVAILLRDPTVSLTNFPYEEDVMISSYLWSQYASVFGDPDSSNAYLAWAEQLKDGAPLALDVGCAVGRFTFEMSAKSDLAVGIDRSVAFIRWARKLMCDRRVIFSVITEGQMTERKEIVLPAHWKSEKVEFIVANALALPFPNSCFSALASLNMLDKVTKPLRHLLEVNRVARHRGARFIFTDPFSWSDKNAPKNEWLGGKTNGEFTGKGFDNVQALLRGKNRIFIPPWSIERCGYVWWKIRNHSNHFELIRSLFLAAAR